MNRDPAPVSRRMLVAGLLAAGLLVAPPRPTPAQTGDPVPTPTADPAAAPTAAPAPAPAAPPADPAGSPPAEDAGVNTIRMNFRNAPLGQILDYLSEAAGFVILAEADLQGPVTVVSHQPLSPDQAADLLTSILIEKGYATVRNERTLKIVPLSQAHQEYLPVRSGADPTVIPRSDELVTQIIPVRYVNARELMQNLEPLMAENSKLSANESSNALVMTDTLANIRRTVEIIRALDTSISSISSLKVFVLQYADAAQMAEVINEVFEDAGSSQRGMPRGGPAAFFEQMRRRGGGDDGGAGVGESEARQAAFRVTAVADERSNSLVVAAPESVMPTIEELVTQMDTNVSDVTEVQVFPLENADAVELAQVVNDLYDEIQNATQGTSQMRGAFGRMPRMPQPPGGDQSSRVLQQSNVVAVGDRRTNSLIVSAARESMLQIAQLIGRLDASSAKRERVYVYPLEHADVDNVAAVLRGMFQEGAASTQTQAANPLTTRASTGASSDLGSEFGRTGSSGGRR